MNRKLFAGQQTPKLVSVFSRRSQTVIEVYGERGGIHFATITGRIVVGGRMSLHQAAELHDALGRAIAFHQGEQK